MNLTNLKLIPATFDHYVLRVSSICDFSEVATKFKTLRKFDPNARYLVIDIAELVNSDEFTPMMNKLDKIAAQDGFEIKFVKSSAIIVGDSFAGKKVIDIPQTGHHRPIKNDTKIISDPIRSGAVIKNDGDVIVLSLLSHNAEVISSGNIHIYGDCRGRLIAGVNGDKSARIFVYRFNAEFISIAGIYKVIEDKLPANLHNKAVQVFLDDKERLNIIPL